MADLHIGNVRMLKKLKNCAVLLSSWQLSEQLHGKFQERLRWSALVFGFKSKKLWIQPYTCFQAFSQNTIILIESNKCRGKYCIFSTETDTWICVCDLRGLSYLVVFFRSCWEKSDNCRPITGPFSWWTMTLTLRLEQWGPGPGCGKQQDIRVKQSSCCGIQFHYCLILGPSCLPWTTMTLS